MIIALVLLIAGALCALGSLFLAVVFDADPGVDPTDGGPAS